MAERGRPTRYSDALAKRICVRLANGETLRSICRRKGFPAESTVRAWALDDFEGFYAQYARARDLGLDAIADETMEISDTARLDQKTKRGPNGVEVTTGDMVERSKLQVDTRKWYLSKLAPKRYGERMLEAPRTKDRLDEMLAAMETKRSELGLNEVNENEDGSDLPPDFAAPKPPDEPPVTN